MADSADDLQEMLQTTDEELRALCMHLNPNKCSTLHLSAKTPVQAIPTVFKIQDIGVTALSNGESATYLDKPVGKLGGCGIPSAAEDSDFYLVDSAFKLLTSKDEEVALQALGQLTRTVRHRVRRQPTDGDMASYMSGCMDDEFSESTNKLRNTWTLARQASRRAQVTWTFTEGLPSLTIADDCLTATKRRGVMKALHDNFQLQESTKLLESPSQGKAMDCVALSPASTHFLLHGKFTRFADWKFIHKARLNHVALNGSKHWLSKERRA
ncbi:retrovirus-related Pol polyprotein from type-1 retrotransposable element R2 [Trichonephila clavata]|uniref:Retrovirus-related Pol polyprotein from type-1 retrotransposable element R2 n=1 Tax=Trichonephila clavata TaxID=2740835 RepID=A0A8X6L3L0_TRICU|nr:retrovirus-related Pol polyprotein from type-1 retrotransposable element R2 [Trichonephila clavata]